MKPYSCLLLAASLATGAAAVPAQSPDAPIDLSRQKTLYVVGYAHLDTQWRWTYPQVIQEFLANTLHNNFALLDKYPDYIFNFTGSRRYEMMAEYYPAEFATLHKYVAAGRWFPGGSSVDEGDANVPSAEALIRHVLYGNHYFRREFGVASREFMLPDCFGFPAALPSILAHCGIAGFSTQKLTWNSAAGIPFKVGVWIGPDGRGVVAALDPGAYGGKVDEDLSQSRGWLERIDHTGSLSGVYVDYHYYGTGDQGGAPPESSVQWIERSVAGTGPVRVVSSTADRMVRDLTAEQTARLPHYQGELLLVNHSAGSINSAGYMKRWNRKNELLADDAERAAVAADWLGAAPYPSARLYRAWDLLLGSQMHDMLPGTSLPLAYQYCWNDECLAQNQFAGVLQDGLGGVAAALDTQGPGVPLVVYNPLSIAREDVVEAEVHFAGRAPENVRVVGPMQTDVPAQIVGRDGDRLTVLILARVPAVGFCVYSVQPAEAPSSGPGSPLLAGPGGIENARYRVGLNAQGDVASIYDKRAGRELLAAPLRLAFQYEKPAIYPAWNMDWEDQSQPPRGYVDGTPAIRVVEAGPVRVALEISREAEGSRFVQTVRLGAGDAGERVEFDSRIDWQSRECALKAVFPLTVANPEATYDGQIGTLRRGINNPKHFEVPQHLWFDLTDAGGAYGAAVLNDCKYGSDKPDDHTLRLTLLYTPGVRDSFQDQACQDEGRHRMLYAIMGHAGDWRDGGVPAAANRLNQPLVAAQVDPHAGRLGRVWSLLSVNSPQVLVMALKRAEDSDAVIVRLNEKTGRPAAGVRVAFAVPILAAREVDGQEQDLGPAVLEGGVLATEVSAYGLRTFAVRLGRPPVELAPPASESVALKFDVAAATAPGTASAQGFDGQGRSYPADALPGTVLCDGAAFALGGAGAGRPDALACQGQTIALPEGDIRRVYVLAAATGGDADGVFGVGERTVRVRVPEWTGFVGQWDTRLWRDPQPPIVFDWRNPLVGLKPAFLKEAEVAWYSSHRHDAAGANEPYCYSYLFKFSFDVPAGARALRLPDEPRIRVFAVSVGRGVHDRVRLASPVFERFADHRLDAPWFSPAPGRFADTTEVALVHPLYWEDGGLHYTLDGSEPTSASPVYAPGKLVLTASTVIKARYIPSGATPGALGAAEGPEATGRFEVQDTTPPRVAAAFGTTAGAQLAVVFSEPVTPASAQDISHYRLGGQGNPRTAVLDDAGRTVTLTFPAVLTGAENLEVAGVADTSPAGNSLVRAQIAPAIEKPTLRIGAIQCPEEARDIPVPAPGGRWSYNFFVRVTNAPANRTLIAGFGRLPEGRDGFGPYLGKASGGLEFWAHGLDIPTESPLNVGRWEMLTVTYDGRNFSVFQDANKIGDGVADLPDGEAVLRVGPLDPWDHLRRFAGEIRDVTFWPDALAPETIGLLWNAGKGAP